VIVVLMGVSGSGKSTVGVALASRLRWPFIDADDLHPATNVDKMRAGIPLTDEDRAPWLDRVVDAARAANAQSGNVVLACSALKQRYRDRIAEAGDVRFVHLTGRAEVIAGRLAARHHRYMPSSLLASQIATLEAPRDAIDIDVDAAVETQVQAIVEALQGGTANPVAADAP
jgi:gluconokinase